MPLARGAPAGSRRILHGGTLRGSGDGRWLAVATARPASRVSQTRPTLDAAPRVLPFRQPALRVVGRRGDSATAGPGGGSGRCAPPPAPPRAPRLASVLILPAPGAPPRRCSARRVSPEHAEPSGRFQNSLVLACAHSRAAWSTLAPGAAMPVPALKPLVPAAEGRWGRSGMPLTLHSAGVFARPL